MGRKRQPVGTTRTQRNRKLVCENDECGYQVYTSRRWIERGLPMCPCGAHLVPDDPDDAALVLAPEELEQHPAVIEYKRAVSSVMHGQAGPGRALRATGRELRPADEVAAQRLERERRKAARARQVGALRRGQLDPTRTPAAAAADEIPF
jgi:hypothetical protein